MVNHIPDSKFLEQWLWDAACSIRGAKDAPKYKDYILPLVFTKRVCDVFDDELNRIAKGVDGMGHPVYRLKTFDRVVANPMWNHDWFTEKDYDADELGRFPKGAGFPGKQSADWGWVQHMLASLNDNGRAAIVLDTGAASRGSGSANTTKRVAGAPVVRGQRPD